MRQRRISPVVVTLTIAWALFLSWVFVGYFSVRGIERPVFTVAEQSDGYEVREYSAYLLAQVTLDDSWEAALSAGSRVLSAYLQGDNVTQASIALTLPGDMGSGPESERIAGIAPVVTQAKDDAYLVSFIIPSSYSFGTVPRPNDPAIRIVEVPPTVMAVRAFSGRLDAERAAREEGELRELLTRDRRATVGPARIVQYHPFWAPPFMRRNEVLIPINAP